MNESSTILLAEDDEIDVLLLRRAFNEVSIANPLDVVSDGQEAIDYLSTLRSAQGPGDRMPALVILDLKMPRMTGFEVLQWLRAEPATRGVPVMVLSSSAHQQDVERALAAGANLFAVKSPSTSDRLEFARLVKGWLYFHRLPVACVDGFRAAQSLHANAPVVR
jgi:two-component system response regulator